ncbi:MAG: hypothetical protein JXP73_00705 [Deltaproteobacteria bacterium]|nr:hypothetical protein [Deltaproteobacteria bacterium]
MELFCPVHYLAASSAPFRGLRRGSTPSEAVSRACKATLARYLLHEQDEHLLYDYFPTLGIFENDEWHTHHADDLRSYVEWRYGSGTSRPTSEPG